MEQSHQTWVNLLKSYAFADIKIEIVLYKTDDLFWDLFNPLVFGHEMKVLRHDFLSLYKFDVLERKSIHQFMKIGLSDFLEILALMCMQNFDVKWLAEQAVLSNSLCGEHA